MIHPAPWSEFLGTWASYITLFGILMHLMAFGVGSLLIVLVTLIRGKLSNLVPRIAWFGGFMLTLLIVSGFFNALWYHLIFGNLYVDFGAAVDDEFEPFLPFDISVIEFNQGRLLSGTIHQVQLYWLLFATLTWGVSFAFYKIIRSQITKLILRQARDNGDASANLAIP